MKTNIPKIKICCIMSFFEAHAAMSYGANALGLVSEMPCGPGILSENEIKNIIARLDPFVMPVLLTSKKTANEIFAQFECCKPGALQLCEPMTEQELKYLSRALPGIPLIRVIHVSGPEAVEEAKTFESLVSAFLLDTGQRSGPIKQLGGTGITHDWSISAKIVSEVHVPVILAGGLNPENVKQAAEYVKPYAVDVCSGVRTNNFLDSGKLATFFSNLT